MNSLTQETLQHATSLIEQLRSGTQTDDEISATVTELDRLLPDPNWFAYTVDRVPELLAEEVVRKAFSHRPILL